MSKKHSKNIETVEAGTGTFEHVDASVIKAIIFKALLFFFPFLGILFLKGVMFKGVREVLGVLREVLGKVLFGEALKEVIRKQVVIEEVQTVKVQVVLRFAASFSAPRAVQSLHAALGHKKAAGGDPRTCHVEDVVFFLRRFI